MHALAATIATALVIGLVAVQPLAGRRRYRRLLASLSHDPGARLRHYRRGLVGEWIAVGIVAVIGALAGRSPGSIGLASGPHPGRAGVETGEVAIVLVISAVLFRAPALREVVRRQARGFLGLLPRTRSERLTFAGL